MARFTRAQVRRRQRTAIAILVVLVLTVVGSCTVLLLRPGRDDDQAPSRDASGNNAVMTVPAVPAAAPIRDQLLDGIEAGADEAIGIDVSAHQKQIDWTAAAADGVTFAYIKATEGSGHTDSQFAANWTGARDAGVTVGAYHYFTLCSPGAEQAADFLAAAPPDDSALPPALDLEFDGACDERPEADHAEQEIAAFLNAVEKAWGRRAVIYSSREWRSHYGLSVAEGRPDWLFSDSGRPSQEDWAVWQLRFDGRVAGIDGPVDIDVLRVEVLREKARLDQGDG